MAELLAMTPGTAPPPLVEKPASRPSLLAETPYLLMLVMALGGVAFTGYTRQPQILYWEILTPIFGVICIATGWRTARAGEGWLPLVWTQTLHWLAFLLTMRLIFLPEVRGVINDNATGLTLLALLALGTFVAGLHARVWQIAAVGIVLGLAVPAVAWLEQSALLLLCGAVLVVAVVGLYFWVKARLGRHAA
jgi:hypothetical protein